VFFWATTKNVVNFCEEKCASPEKILATPKYAPKFGLELACDELISTASSSNVGWFWRATTSRQVLVRTSKTPVKARSASGGLKGSNVLRQITNQLTFPVITAGARRSSPTVLGIVRVRQIATTLSAPRDRRVVIGASHNEAKMRARLPASS